MSGIGPYRTSYDVRLESGMRIKADVCQSLWNYGFTPWSSLPPIRLLGELRTLCPHDAEALPGGRFHHPPALDLGDPLGAQLLQPRDLGIDIVGLDVEMDPARMVHLLDLDIEFVGAGVENGVVLVLGVGRRPDLQAQSLAPETRGGFQILGPAIDDESAELAAMHATLP